MKKTLFLLLLLGSFALNASAHHLEETVNSSLLLHIEPGEDTAVVDTPVLIHFNLKNTQPGFDVNVCDCTLSIGKDGKEIYTGKLSLAPEGSEFNFKGVPFTFPAGGEYSLTLKAAPKTKGVFEPFELIDSLAVTSNFDNKVIIRVIAGFVVVALGVFLIKK